MQRAIANINRSQEQAVVAALKTVYFMAKKNLANDIFGDMKQFLVLQVSEKIAIKTKIIHTQRKQVCCFDTQKCAKPMSPILTHCTCAKLKGVLIEHVYYITGVPN